MFFSERSPGAILFAEPGEKGAGNRTSLPGMSCIPKDMWEPLDNPNAIVVIG